MGGGIDSWLTVGGVSPVDQFAEIVTERAVRAEAFFIEQSLYAASEADLIGMALRAHGPAHAAVPAAAQGEHQHTRDAGHRDSERP